MRLSYLEVCCTEQFLTKTQKPLRDSKPLATMSAGDVESLHRLCQKHAVFILAFSW